MEVVEARSPQIGAVYFKRGTRFMSETFNGEIAAQSAPTIENIESAVQRCYARAARRTEPSLCCPTQYDSRFIEMLPPEIIEKDYGCGDPSPYVKEGETVVDLESGAGKSCYILSQKVGGTGRVIGVDFTDEMLVLARILEIRARACDGCDNVSKASSYLEASLDSR